MKNKSHDQKVSLKHTRQTASLSGNTKKNSGSSAAVGPILSTGFWLAKSEPDVYGIANLKRDGKTLWEGVRNYQARNFMRAMNKGDRVLFYHSNAQPSGIAGVAVVRSTAQADPTQFDASSEFFDSAATKEKPRWLAVELAFECQFAQIISLDQLREVKALANLLILQRGNRLSVTPVNAHEYGVITQMG